MSVLGSIRDYQRLLWSIRGNKGIMDYYGQLRTIKDYQGVLRTIIDYQGVIETIREYQGVLSAIRDFQSLLGGLEILGLLWTIKGLLKD